MEEQQLHYADEQLETMLHRLRKSDPQIVCPTSSKQVAKMCINPTCKTALRCSDGKCETCGRDAHHGCISVPLEQITELINQRLENSRDMMSGVFRVEEEFIQTIRRRRQEFMEQFMMGRIKEEGLKCIERIYTDKNFQALSGKQAKELCVLLQPQESHFQNRQKRRQKIAQYAKELEKQLENIENTIKTIFKTEIHHYHLETFQIDSKVLQLKGQSSSDLAFIKKALNDPKEVQLIFRASEHGFKASQFHKLCDNIEDTFILLRTQFGKTIGGFSHYTWNQVDHDKWVSDPEKRAFLLQIDLHEKMIPTKQSMLVRHRSNEGPIFGGGHDLYISDSCETKNSCCYLGHTYNHEGTNKYVKGDQMTHTAISGAPNGNDFKIVEYEVFRVIYK